MRLNSKHVGNTSARSIFSQRRNTFQEKKPIIPTKTSAILVTRQHGGIGDMLMITPTIREIKEQNPGIPIVVCTTPTYGRNAVLFDILKNNPYVDRIISVDKLIEYSFQKIYNFGTGQEVSIETDPNHPTGNRIDIFADLAGVKLKNKCPVYNIAPSEKKWAEKWVLDNILLTKKYLIGIQVQASASKRTWPEEKSLLLAFEIVNKWKDDASVLLFYDGFIEVKDRQYPNIYPIVKMPIRRVAALINECQVLVAPDSGLLHLAGALNIKTIGLFGSTPPLSRISYYPGTSAVVGFCTSGPCWYKPCDKKFECMRSITVNSVINKLNNILGRKKTKLKESILVIRRGGIGDLVMLSNALKKLKDMDKGTDIYLATLKENIPLLKGVTYLKDVFSIEDLETSDYETIIDLRMAVEPPQIGYGRLDWDLYISKNRVEIFEDLVGLDPEITKNQKKSFPIFVDKQIKLRMKETLKDLKGMKIGIQVSTKSYYRTIPSEYIEPLCELITKKLKASVVLFGQTEAWCEFLLNLKGHKILNLINKTNLEAWCEFLLNLKGHKILNLINKTNLQEMVGLCSELDVIIAPDSSTLHIGGALGIKTLGIFGNIDPYTRTFYYPTVTNLYPKGELKCIPCWDITPALCKEPPTPGAKCMKLFTPERIFEHLKEIL